MLYLVGKGLRVGAGPGDWPALLPTDRSLLYDWVLAWKGDVCFLLFFKDGG